MRRESEGGDRVIEEQKWKHVKGSERWREWEEDRGKERREARPAAAGSREAAAREARAARAEAPGGLGRRAAQCSPPPPLLLKHRMRAPFGEVALGGNANSTGKCKCKEALRALCANIRPGSAAPAELPGTSAPPRPGSSLIHFAVTSRRRSAEGARPRGAGAAPRLMEPETDQQKRGGGRARGRGVQSEARRTRCWALPGLEAGRMGNRWGWGILARPPEPQFPDL